MTHSTTRGQDGTGNEHIVLVTGRHSSISQHAIVLDLDETLVHTMPEGSEVLLSNIMNSSEYLDIRGRVYQFVLNDVFTKKGSGLRSHYWGVKRPHLNLFLAFCYSYFKYLVIWSAGQEAYVNSLVELLFEGIGKPDIVYNFKHCIITNDGGYHKPLSLLFNDPRVQGKLRAENTFFVDDRSENFLEHKFNSIIIPRYDKENITALASNDPSLMQLRQWFLTPSVLGSRDVRTLDKKSIFLQPPLPPVLPPQVGTVPWYFMQPLLSITSPANQKHSHYYHDEAAPA